MSHLFQRPLCEMGRAFDYAYRPTVGPPRETDGGGCDDRPHRTELYAAESDPAAAGAAWQPFALCPEHEQQLRAYDRDLAARHVQPRFRSAQLPT